jgi:hypothetical protein
MGETQIPADGVADRQRLRDLIHGYRLTQAIYVVATLGIPDLIGERACDTSELATASGSNVDALHRVLRALAAARLLHEDPEGKFSLTQLGLGLRSDVAGSVSAWAKFVARPAMWGAWGELLHTVQTGENAFHHLHGQNTWQFRAANTDESEIFDAAMREDSSRIVAALLASYDFSEFRHIVDVGGGDGTLLAGILVGCPEARGTLLDLEHVVAKAAPVFARARVQTRVAGVAGSFFEHVPAGADLYLLKHVVHNWKDAEAAAILRTCREAVPPHGKLLLIERFVGAPRSDAEVALADLNMLVNAGGRERTLDQFRSLLMVAGFVLKTTIALPGAQFIVEAIPG